jgi:uncharacterized protein
VAAWQDQLHAFIGEFPDPAYGTGHSRRVYALSIRLAAEEGLTVDPDCLYAAAFLHDLGAMEPYLQEGVDHVERSLQAAPAILSEIGFDQDRVQRVLGCIAGHMFYSEPDDWPEDTVFHDADTLDFMGSVGVMSILTLVGRDDWTPDLPAAIELIRRFRRELPDALVTGVAREWAAWRAEEMEAFLSGVSEGTDGLRLL